MNYDALAFFESNQNYKWEFLYEHLHARVSYTTPKPLQYMTLIANTPNNNISQTPNRLAYS